MESDMRQEKSWQQRRQKDTAQRARNKKAGWLTSLLRIPATTGSFFWSKPRGSSPNWFLWPFWFLACSLTCNNGRVKNDRHSLNPLVVIDHKRGDAPSFSLLYHIPTLKPNIHPHPRLSRTRLRTCDDSKAMRSISCEQIRLAGEAWRNCHRSSENLRFSCVGCCYADLCRSSSLTCTRHRPRPVHVIAPVLYTSSPPTCTRHRPRPVHVIAPDLYTSSPLS